jgi:DnaJ-class molecular chaperone
LSTEWHPEKHPEDRVIAQQKFNQICEAYYILSDQSRRANYDQLRKTNDIDIAHRTFEKFFDEFGAEEH